MDKPVARNPWALYDELISAVPDDIGVIDWALGTEWCYVEAECGVGVSKTLSGGPAPTHAKTPRAQSLRHVAALAKSWNMQDASLGIAALNAWYARRELTDALGARYDTGRAADRETMAHDPLAGLAPHMAGARVAVIGHFPHVYDLATQCQALTVLERVPRERDLPDAASEFVLPEQDFVFATGTTLTNKTFVRIAELSQDAFVVITGPSAIPASCLFDFGVSVIGGRVVDDAERAKFIIKNGYYTPFGTAIRRMCVCAPDFTLVSSS